MNPNEREDDKPNPHEYDDDEYLRLTTETLPGIIQDLWEAGATAENIRDEVDNALGNVE